MFNLPHKIALGMAVVASLVFMNPGRADYSRIATNYCYQKKEKEAEWKSYLIELDQTRERNDRAFGFSACLPPEANIKDYALVKDFCSRFVGADKPYKRLWVTPYAGSRFLECGIPLP